VAIVSRAQCRLNSLRQQPPCRPVHVPPLPIQYSGVSDSRRAAVGRCRLSLGIICRICPNAKTTFLGYTSKLYAADTASMQ
jgi:hypothetical protein